MIVIEHKAFARAGLVGNPSDGYFGKTLAFVVRNFKAKVTLYEWERLELVLSQEDRSRFDSIAELVRDVELHGYYGGVRLVKATVKKFWEYCRQKGIELHGRNFSVRYETDIPRCVGLAGSSAIIVATLRCLMEFYGVEIDRRVQPSLALSVETDELGIPAGLQDRVVQVYEGLVYMDFARERIEQIDGLSCGVYEPIDPRLLPPLYLAYRTDASEPTEVPHANLRNRYLQREPAVVEGMAHLAELTVQARAAVLRRDYECLGRLIDANFDQRAKLCPLAPKHVAMIEAARGVHATAKYAGSGGAIIGTCADQSAFARLKAALEPLGCRVIRPIICPPQGAENA